MGEVRVISAVESAKIKAGNELPKPRALVVVQWIGFFGVGALLLRLIWILVCSLAVVFGDYEKLDLGALLFESVFLFIALGLFLGPFLAMFFCLKRSRYFVPIFCTMGAMIACEYITTVPSIVSVMGFVPPVAIWVFPSIRKWYNSLV